MNTENVVEQMLSDLKDKSPAGIPGTLEQRVDFLEAFALATLRVVGTEEAFEILRLTHNQAWGQHILDIQAEYQRQILGNVG